jgi:hypothetical protein
VPAGPGQKSDCRARNPWAAATPETAPFAPCHRLEFGERRKPPAVGFAARKDQAAAALGHKVGQQRLGVIVKKRLRLAAQHDDVKGVHRSGRAREKILFDRVSAPGGGNDRHVARGVQPIDGGQFHVGVALERLHEKFGVPVRLAFHHQHAHLPADGAQKHRALVVGGVRLVRLRRHAENVTLFARVRRLYRHGNPRQAVRVRQIFLLATTFSCASKSTLKLRLG